ncbi:hypothetical protein V8E36_004657 [Tilletia maclaganii]
MTDPASASAGASASASTVPTDAAAAPTPSAANGSRSAHTTMSLAAAGPSATPTPSTSQPLSHSSGRSAVLALSDDEQAGPRDDAQGVTASTAAALRPPPFSFMIDSTQLRLFKTRVDFGVLCVLPAVAYKLAWEQGCLPTDFLPKLLNPREIADRGFDISAEFFEACLTYTVDLMRFVDADPALIAAYENLNRQIINHPRYGSDRRALFYWHQSQCRLYYQSNGRMALDELDEADLDRIIFATGNFDREAVDDEEDREGSEDEVSEEDDEDDAEKEEESDDEMSEGWIEAIREEVAELEREAQEAERAAQAPPLQPQDQIPPVQTEGDAQTTSSVPTASSVADGKRKAEDDLADAERSTKVARNGITGDEIYLHGAYWRIGTLNIAYNGRASDELSNADFSALALMNHMTLTKKPSANTTHAIIGPGCSNNFRDSVRALNVPILSPTDVSALLNRLARGGSSKTATASEPPGATPKPPAVLTARKTAIVFPSASKPPAVLTARKSGIVFPSATKPPVVLTARKSGVQYTSAASSAQGSVLLGSYAPSGSGLGRKPVSIRAPYPYTPAPEQPSYSAASIRPSSTGSSTSAQMPKAPIARTDQWALLRPRPLLPSVASATGTSRSPLLLRGSAPSATASSYTIPAAAAASKSSTSLSQHSLASQPRRSRDAPTAGALASPVLLHGRSSPSPQPPSSQQQAQSQAPSASNPPAAATSAAVPSSSATPRVAVEAGGTTATKENGQLSGASSSSRAAQQSVQQFPKPQQQAASAQARPSTTSAAQPSTPHYSSSLMRFGSSVPAASRQHPTVRSGNGTASSNNGYNLGFAPGLYQNQSYDPCRDPRLQNRPSNSPQAVAPSSAQPATSRPPQGGKQP